MINIIFSSFILIFIYTYAGYLMLCLAWAKLFPLSRQRRRIYPSLTLLIPCYNEECIILKKLENIHALDYPRDKLQIIVASESDDATNDIAAGFRREKIELYAFDNRRGKTALLYDTMPHARGEITVFSDANVMLKEDALKQIAENFADERVGAVTGSLTVANPRASSVSWGEHAYKKYESALRCSNSARGRVLNPDGALFAIRTRLYNPLSINRGDDFELVIRILIAGYLSVFEPRAQSYENACITSVAEISRKVRMVSWFWRSCLLLAAESCRKGRLDIAAQIISHKLLRWLTPFTMLGIFISNALLLGKGRHYQWFFLGQILFYALGVAGWYRQEAQKKKAPFLLRASHYWLMFNYAFFIGVIKNILPRSLSPSWEKTRG